MSKLLEILGRGIAVNTAGLIWHWIDVIIKNSPDLAFAEASADKSKSSDKFFRWISSINSKQKIFKKSNWHSNNLLSTPAAILAIMCREKRRWGEFPAEF